MYIRPDPDAKQRILDRLVFLLVVALGLLLLLVAGCASTEPAQTLVPGTAVARHMKLPCTDPRVTAHLEGQEASFRAAVVLVPQVGGGVLVRPACWRPVPQRDAVWVQMDRDQGFYFIPAEQAEPIPRT